MAIVKMKKFTVIALDSVKTNVISDLMDLGVTEINRQDEKMTEEDWATLVLKDGNENEVSALESQLSQTEFVLKTLEAADTSKKPLFKTRKAVSSEEFSDRLSQRAIIENDVQEILTINNQLKDLKTESNKIATTMISLKPWLGYAVPLELHETKYTYITMGVIPSLIKVDSLMTSMGEATDKCAIELIGTDEELHYLSLIYYKPQEEDVLEVLRKYGFSKLNFRDMKGTASENLSGYQKRLDDIKANISKIEAELAAKVSCMESIRFLYDELAIRHDREKVRSKMLKTKQTFFFEGWVPKEAESLVEEVLTRHGCFYEIIEPEKDEETPVLLKNNNFMHPVEVITEMYALPNSKEIDPTPIFALFYICFFGMMFADMAYGIILAAVCFFAIRKYKLEGMAFKLIKSLAYCGVSTFIWGALFGGFFGNLVNVVSRNFFGYDIAIKPLWFDSLVDPMKLLIFSCILGTIHLFIGMGIKAYIQIRNGKILAAINDVIVWYIFLIGLGLLLFGEAILPGSKNIGMWMAIVGAAGIVILPFYLEKGAAKAVGLWNLYGMTGYLADILSYSRLLALGLASAVIAQVVNILGSLFGTGIVAAILFIVVALIGHVFNFAINALGSFVHSARLQYVEFFGKFYEGGGVPFDPFMKKTKYVKIVKEEK